MGELDAHERRAGLAVVANGSTPPPTERWRCWPPLPPGGPDNPASWAGYAQLAPHVLAAGPLVDASPG